MTPDGHHPPTGRDRNAVSNVGLNGAAAGDSAADDPAAASGELLEACLERLADLAPVVEPRQWLALIPDSCGIHRRRVLVEFVKLDMAAGRSGVAGRGLNVISRLARAHSPAFTCPANWSCSGWWR